MIHLLVRPDYALLSDDGGYNRRVDGKFEVLDSRDSLEIIHWLGSHPGIFSENDGKPVGYTKTEAPLRVTPFPTDEKITFCVCAEGDPNRMVLGVGLCASPAEAVARFSAYQETLNSGPEAFFSRAPAMVLEARMPSATSLPEVEYPLPVCTKWVMLHHPHAVSAERAVHCHVQEGWQLGCPKGQSDWVLACHGRQVLDAIPAYEAGYWAQKLAVTPAPATPEQQESLVGALLREKHGYLIRDPELVAAPAASLTPSAPLVPMAPDKGSDLTAPQQQR